MAEIPHRTSPAGLCSLAQLIETWPDAVFVYDGDHGRHILVNAAAEELVGYGRDEILNLAPGALSHPADAAELVAVFEQAGRNGWVRRPWRVLRRDGSVVPTELTLTRRRIDDRQIAQGVFRTVCHGEQPGGNAHGTTDERLAILERTSLAVVTLDRDGVVTSWNAGATERFRMTPDETIGRQVRDLVQSDQDLAAVESLMSPHVQRDDWVSRVTIRPPGDAEYEALVTCSAIRADDGELRGFLMITAPLDAVHRPSVPRMRRARVQCASCGHEVAGTMRRKYCSEKCRQWAYYHRHLEAQRARSRQRHQRRRSPGDGVDGLEDRSDDDRADDGRASD